MYYILRKIVLFIAIYSLIYSISNLNFFKVEQKFYKINLKNAKNEHIKTLKKSKKANKIALKVINLSKKNLKKSQFFIQLKVIKEGFIKDLEIYIGLPHDFSYYEKYSINKFFKVNESLIFSFDCSLKTYCFRGKVKKRDLISIWVDKKLVAANLYKAEIRGERYLSKHLKELLKDLERLENNTFF